MTAQRLYYCHVTLKALNCLPSKAGSTGSTAAGATEAWFWL